jgi:hypothetical protein
MQDRIGFVLHEDSGAFFFFLKTKNKIKQAIYGDD